jgi:hypothetical protein
MGKVVSGLAGSVDRFIAGPHARAVPRAQAELSPGRFSSSVARRTMIRVHAPT